MSYSDFSKSNKTLALFLTFAKIGMVTFGGGYAMIPLIQRETVDNRHWVTNEDILDIIAIAESTPGPIAVNAATFIGRKVAGIPGAVCATLGVALPSFVIIAVIANILQAFQNVKTIQYAFWGVRAGVLALLLKALWSMFRQCKKNLFSGFVMAFSLAAAVFTGINVIWIISICGCLGRLNCLFRKERV